MDGKAKPINFISTSRNTKLHGKTLWIVDFRDQNHMKDGKIMMNGKEYTNEEFQKIMLQGI